jgi:para-aminobenzoate synthetase component 1
MHDTLWFEQKKGFEEINRLGHRRTPFLFILSYDKTRIFAQSLDTIDNAILYKLEDWRNYRVKKRAHDYTLTQFPADFATYRAKMERIQEQIRAGNTYLLNLTCATPIETNLNLEEIFRYSRAKFKLYFKDQFVCFSPERFIDIQGNTIATYPMKGTIDADLPNAKYTILHDRKEMAEHVMIVDLMRNDLGIVGSHVRVEQFRYVDRVRAGDKDLLQVSSRITAQLPDEWRDHIGSLLDHLTPAGSITGTPKWSTVEIIRQVEGYARGFYTGIFGIFDGESLRSGVMIRFVEQTPDGLIYKSGGGITIDSDAQSEYEELVDKIYLPV